MDPRGAKPVSSSGSSGHCRTRSLLMNAGHLVGLYGVQGTQLGRADKWLFGKQSLGTQKGRCEGNIKAMLGK